jgi:CubicO group peptidase (beta-lactamase class C family)
VVYGRSMHMKGVMARLASLLAWVICTAIILSPHGTKAATAEPSAPKLDHSDVEAWLDGFVPSALKAQDIAGGVVVIVKDGKVLLSKGYGYSDVAKRILVSPSETLFRPGSISKLFTWTAIMQLVEQGKIGLDDDINKYIDFKITGRGGAPITIRQLLTHRAGFEEGIKDLIVFEHKPGLNAQGFLKRWIPQRIYKPGAVPAYSNYGAALAGYIVERVSGMRFETYVERNIFVPLAMTNATFNQPLSAAMLGHMSKGYMDGSDPAQRFELVTPPAAGGLSITGDDMAQFMIAHLRNGRLGSAQILKPETAALMHTSATTFLPGLDPFLLGFYATDINGHRVISHGGNTVLFHSYMRLFINDGVGIYISLNSTGKDYAQLQQSIFESFADRYFPQQSIAPIITKGAAADANLVAGEYRSTRRSESNFLAISNLLGPMTITANEDASITVTDGAAVRYVHIGPLLWRSLDGKLRFSAAKQDRKIRWVAGGAAAAVQAWEPYPASQSPKTWSPLGALALMIVGLTAVAWPLAAGVRRAMRQPFVITGKSRIAYRVIRLAALLTLIVIFGWLSVISSLETLDFPSDSLILTLQAGLFGALIALLASALWYVRTALTDKRRLGALYGIALILAALILLWIAYAFSFFAFTSNY